MFFMSFVYTLEHVNYDDFVDPETTNILLMTICYGRRPRKVVCIDRY